MLSMRIAGSAENHRSTAGLPQAAHRVGQHAEAGEADAPQAALGALPHRDHHARREDLIEWKP